MDSPREGGRLETTHFRPCIRDAPPSRAPVAYSTIDFPNPHVQTNPKRLQESQLLKLQQVAKITTTLMGEFHSTDGEYGGRSMMRIKN
jgi:hypothetical protein